MSHRALLLTVFTLVVPAILIAAPDTKPAPRPGTANADAAKNDASKRAPVADGAKTDARSGGIADARSGGQADAKSDVNDTRKSAPAFDARDLAGNRIQLADLKGKVVVVSFWATWCAPCMQELPHLDAIMAANKGKVVVLAVSTDGPETAAKVSTTVRQKRFKMPVIHDSAGKLVSLLNPRGNNPFTVFIDKNGRIAKTHEGFTSGDEKKHKAFVEKLLAE